MPSSGSRVNNGVERTITFADYHRLPGNTPERDNNLERGELITAIELPKNNLAAHSYYLKVRDRSSYAFAWFPLQLHWSWNQDG
jgi:xanthine dehydrogenase YagS FAD-binding subunit